MDDAAPRVLEEAIEKRLEEMRGMPVLYDVFQVTLYFYRNGFGP